MVRISNLLRALPRRPTCLSLRPTATSTSTSLLQSVSRPRWISERHVARKQAEEAKWGEQAELIKLGVKPHIWDFLVERGFVKDIAGRPEQVKELLRRRRIGVYCGVDPTAESMHLGHLVPFMAVFFMWAHGYQGVTLLGGSTARVGDPSDRTEGREVMSNADVSKNITKIHYQLKKLWGNVNVLTKKYKYESSWAGPHRLVNNNTWLLGLSIYDFMKRLGRHIRIGPMLSRDSVKLRQENGEGMTFGEFAYPLLQGWDFWQLYSKLGVQMQIGGSDQYGNIVTGIDIVKTIRSTEEAPDLKMEGGWMNDPVGFTTPLLTDASGAKFGKSAGNAVWLDAFMTTPFDLYGYLVGRADEDVERFLKLLTFVPTPKITEIMKEHMEDPKKRVAQHLLAFEVMSLVHGTEVAVRTQEQHKLMFGKTSTESGQPVTDDDGKIVVPEGHVTINTAPQMDVKLPKSLIVSGSVPAILVAAGMFVSRTEAQKMIKNGGVYVAAAPGNQKRGLIPGNLDWTPIKLWFPGEAERYLIDEKMLILRRGKNHVRIVEMMSDEEFEKTDLTYPGQPYRGRTRMTVRDIIEEAKAQGVPLTERRVYQEIKQMHVHPGRLPMRMRGLQRRLNLDEPVMPPRLPREQTNDDMLKDEPDGDDKFPIPSTHDYGPFRGKNRPSRRPSDDIPDRRPKKAKAHWMGRRGSN